MPAHRPGRLARPAAPDLATAALELLLRVLADLDAGDGVLIWLLDRRGRLAGLLAGPPTWPIDDAVTDLLIEHALDDDASAVIVVRRRAVPPGSDAAVTADPASADDAGFAAFDAACARADLPVLWHLVDDGRQVRVRELA
jgi:hypothetical protein